MHPAQDRTRRDLLRGAALAAGGLLANGCTVSPSSRARSPASISAAARVTTTDVPVSKWVFGAGDQQPARDALATMLAADLPDLGIEWLPKAYPGMMPATGQWWIRDAAANDGANVGSGYVDLNESLVTLNFSGQGLLAGLTHSFEFATGDQYALPLTVAPIGLRLRQDALAAAQLPTPHQLDLTDLEQLFDALLAQVHGGALSAVTSVRPPLLGRYDFQYGFGYGAMANSAQTWVALVQGFGGWIFRDGGFDCTNAGCVEAFSTMLRWHPRYGPPAGLDTTVTNGLNRYWFDGPAVTFWTFGPDNPYDKDAPRDVVYAPWPALRQPQGVPVVPTGWAVIGFPPDAQIEAAVRTMVWFYGQPAQTALARTLETPPLLADDHLQVEYGSNPVRSAGAASIGLVDPHRWSDFFDPLAQVPATAAVNRIAQAIDPTTARGGRGHDDGRSGPDRGSEVDQRVFPMLTYADAAAAITFLTAAFGFREDRDERYTEPDGRISHALLTLGGAAIMLAQGSDAYQGPAQHAAACPAARAWLDSPYVVDGVLVCIDDVVSHLATARATGAQILSGLEEGGPGPRYRAADPEGHRWMFLQRP